MSNRHLLVIATMALATGAAFAQGTYREDQRDAVLEQRIHDGQANGSITPREAYRLQRQVREIHRAERRAASDGVISRDERRQIRYMQDRADQSIDRFESNRHTY